MFLWWSPSHTVSSLVNWVPVTSSKRIGIFTAASRLFLSSRTRKTRETPPSAIYSAPGYFFSSAEGRRMAYPLAGCSGSTAPAGFCTTVAFRKSRAESGAGRGSCFCLRDRSYQIPHAAETTSATGISHQNWMRIPITGLGGWPCGVKPDGKTPVNDDGADPEVDVGWAGPPLPEVLAIGADVVTVYAERGPASGAASVIMTAPG